MKLFTTEAVTKFHPDKYADQISDAIVTACMRNDHNSRCGIETLVKGKTVVLAGEVKTKAKINYEAIVRRVANKLGYEVDKVINLISEQSSEISKAVDGKEDIIGAGDQGIVFGYASNETKEYMPLPILLANKLTRQLAKVRKEDKNSPLKPDGKSYSLFAFDGCFPSRLSSQTERPGGPA